MKTIIIFCLHILLVGTLYAQSSFDLHSVTFTDGANGWAVADYGIIIHTTNGGETWIQQSSETNLDLYSIYFTDENNGWAAGGNYSFEISEKIMLHTTDGGESWIEQRLVGVEGGPIRYVFFPNISNGWLLSSALLCSYLFHTIDGGNSWFIISNADICPISIYFTDVNNGWIAGNKWDGPFHNYGHITHTTNGGYNWVAQSIPDSNVNRPHSVYFTDPDNGWSVGNKGVSYGLILRTTNSGSTWTEYPFEISNYLNSVSFVNTSFGCSVGNAGTILHTTDGGLTWLPQSSGTSNDLQSVCFTNVNNGSAVGNDGTLLYTSDGGDTWNFQTFSAITLLTPVGGETWLNGTNQDIIWASNNVDYVRLELSIDNGTSWATIVDSTPSAGTFSWVVSATTPSTECLMRISDISDSTVIDESDSVFTIDILPSVENILGKNIPTKFELIQNYPNPFNPTTKIRYQLPKESKVVIKIYDILGAEVLTLLNDKKEPGVYEVELNAQSLPSGVYFYRLQAGNFVETKKMVLMK